MMASKTVNTRIQLKSDTEMNWRKSVLSTDHRDGLKTSGSSFVPLAGELIIYSPDNDSPAYSRLKVGDGIHNVLALPFIDSGTLNGSEVEIVKKNGFINFPSPGSPDKLYIDLTTNKVYHFDITSGYTELSQIVVDTTSIDSITDWYEGVMTTAKITNNIFTVTNGTVPTLTTTATTVVTNVTKG